MGILKRQIYVIKKKYQNLQNLFNLFGFSKYTFFKNLVLNTYITYMLKTLSKEN